MKRRFFHTALVTLLLLLPTAAMGYDFEADGIYYHVETGQATVTNNGQTGCYSGDIVIPETITHDGTIYQVTAIGDSAFKNCTALTSIAPPNSIATIGISHLCSKHRRSWSFCLQTPLPLISSLE